MTYKGIPVHELVGMPDDTMIGTRFGSTIMDSNIHVGVDWDQNSTEDVIKVMPVQNKSELWFVKMLFKVGVQIGWGEELVLYGT